MAVERRLHKKKPDTFRVYWVNPITKKREQQAFDSEVDARIYDADIQKRLQRDPMSFKEQPKQLTFGGLSALYVKKKNFAPSTLESLLCMLKSSIVPDFPKKPILEVTLEEMKRLSALWLERGAHQNTVHRRMEVIKAIFNWAVEEGHINVNPIAGYKSKSIPAEIIPPITRDELNRIYKHASPHIKRIIILATSVGCRVGQTELFQIRWEHVNWLDRILRIPAAKKYKAITFRDVAINKRLYAYLESWWEEDKKTSQEFLINKGDKLRSIKHIKTGWALTLKRAGITRRIRPYDMRHLFATRALSEGHSLKSVAEIMGHSDASMLLKTYQHVLDKDKRAVVESILMPDEPDNV